ncbi:protein CMSS1-like isoform X2 [Stylophora pistillata]|uniref:protein CMSS1-like isoform X1 n=1 Tax=Stylophora pistillata TaxID=50429 RepID=UPI000C044232|nr:protein CMSS1-like isoform X1 [Stylophora pistillata]XP_022783272.1 protein CMSS1-like isoform X2 [Stylophora pistillata]
MADALGDEWWLDEKDIEDTEIETKRENKRRKDEDGEDNSKNNGNKQMNLSDVGPNEPKAKKRRKKPMIESITTKLHGPDAPNILWSSFCDCTAGSLSTLELEDVSIDDSCCLVDDSIHSGCLDELLSYLKNIIPQWTRDVDKLNKKGDRGSPLLLFVSSAATRVVELNRAATDFKGKCKTVKLFAKHMKISEQEQFLESQVVHLGIGTPSRILKLIQNDSLKTKRLKYVILDWTWRDQKLRRMVDIPEVRGELISLLKDFIFPLAKASKLKIGLF